MLWWLKRADLRELPLVLLTALKKPATDAKLGLPQVRGTAELLANKINVKLLEPVGGGNEAEAIRRGLWRAAGRWVKGCECTRALGYPCYGRPSELFDVHSCFPFSHKVHYLAVPVAPTKGADIKYPWFYTRAYHFARGALLGVSPPKEFFKVVRPYYGPGWFNAMEAGIRAINLAFSLGTSPYRVEIVEQLLAALLYIPINLEVGVYTSNHLMCDLYGLVVSSAVLSKAHRQFLRAALKYLNPLIYEINKQLDGWDYEASTAYHLLVLEGALATLYVLKRLEPELAERLWSGSKGALKKAAELLASVTLPDGSFPLIGDCGSDRALVLESLEFDYSSTITALSLAKTLGLLDSFPRLEGRAREEAALVLKALGTSYPNEVPRKSSEPWLHSYNDGRLLVTLACAPTRKGAPPGHHHDDKGSFTIWKDGWVVLDPGTFTYTGLKEVRDLMRSKFFHNSLRGCCAFPGPFDATCNCLCEFYGYMKVRVTEDWRREISVKENRVIIKDFIEGRGTMGLMLPARPEVKGEVINLPNATVRLPSEPKVLEAFYSPSYGVVKKGYLALVEVEGDSVTEVVL